MLRCDPVRKCQPRGGYRLGQETSKGNSVLQDVRLVTQHAALPPPVSAESAHWQRIPAVASGV